MTTPESFRAVRESAATAARTAEISGNDLGIECVEVTDDPQAPEHAFMVQRLRFPEGEIVHRKRFYLVDDSTIVVCNGTEIPIDHNNVQLGGRASATEAGLLELLEPVDKYTTEELKWKPLRGNPPVSPREFALLALKDLLFPK